MNPQPTSPKPALTKSQETVLAALAEGHSISAAARMANIHRSSIYLWQRDNEAFIEALRKIRSAQEFEVSQNIHALAVRSVEVLERILTDDRFATVAVRAKVAFSVLNGSAAPKPAQKLAAAPLLNVLAAFQSEPQKTMVQDQQDDRHFSTVSSAVAPPVAVAAAVPPQINISRKSPVAV